jgi:hypothetical protein
MHERVLRGIPLKTARGRFALAMIRGFRAKQGARGSG